MAKRTLTQEFTKGILAEHAVTKALLGMCPTLAVTNSATNGFAMAAATAFVLLSSST
ncbi:MAG: electron transport complex subunit E, partial [Proteobacteria bacterium]|nr:electron transport complex subunit E [Pseudomonadota bacterium]